MVNAFIDTSVLVDVIRKRPLAANWLVSQSDLGVTPIVRMELVAGAKNKVDQMKAIRLVAKFEMVFLTKDDMEWAMDQQAAFTLSRNIGMNDCLIASVCHRLQLPLYTTNIKHFITLLGALAQRPY